MPKQLNKQIKHIVLSLFCYYLLPPLPSPIITTFITLAPCFFFFCYSLGASIWVCVFFCLSLFGHVFYFDRFVVVVVFSLLQSLNVKYFQHKLLSYWNHLQYTHTHSYTFLLAWLWFMWFFPFCFFSFIFIFWFYFRSVIASVFLFCCCCCFTNDKRSMKEAITKKKEI